MPKGGGIRRHVWVSGLVQGVFYRDSCRREAEARGLCGWVRNLRDGRVEAVFEGGHEPVSTMVEWCRLGPPRARVVRVEVVEEAPEGLTGFRVRQVGE
ncbi:MAG: acylphosphatase [Actinobacteria bacterium]|nr:MAG: acylphosphatase [Actinomycetota bacterium]RIK06047.1 MAG: acylphosphatase [Acidobacteriota bacterium]